MPRLGIAGAIAFGWVPSFENVKKVQGATVDVECRDRVSASRGSFAKQQKATHAATPEMTTVAVICMIWIIRVQFNA